MNTNQLVLFNLALPLVVTISVDFDVIAAMCTCLLPCSGSVRSAVTSRKSDFAVLQAGFLIERGSSGVFFRTAFLNVRIRSINQSNGPERTIPLQLIDPVIQTLLINFLGIIMMKFLSRLFVGMLLLTAISAHADTDYSDMVVFGDSLSDPGNVFVLSGNVTVRPYPEGNIPTLPYPMGKGKTYSNGATWSQLVAAQLKLNRATGPALRNQRFTNYAFGGARASSSAGGDFDMSAQVTQYLADNGGSAYIYRDVPEPATLTMLALGGLAVLRKRRMVARK